MLCEPSIVRIISYRAIREFAVVSHKVAKEPLDSWFKVAKHADWTSLVEVRKQYSSADLVGSCVVFNIGGNKYRLITRIFFRAKKVYIVSVLTHKEYDAGGWKNECDC